MSAALFKRAKTHMVMAHVGVGEGKAGAGGWNLPFDKFAELTASLSETGN